MLFLYVIIIQEGRVARPGGSMQKVLKEVRVKKCNGQTEKDDSLC